MDLSSTTIESGRLRLVPVSPEFREEMFREFTDEITTFLRAPTPKSIADTDAFIEKSTHELKDGSELILVVTRKDTGGFLGCCGIHKTNTRGPEFGIWIKKSAHGNGYGKEVIHALKRWADTTLDFDNLRYCAAKANTNSRKIAESLGGTVAREYIGKTGAGIDVEEVEYHIPR